MDKNFSNPHIDTTEELADDIARWLYDIDKVLVALGKSHLVSALYNTGVYQEKSFWPGDGDRQYNFKYTLSGNVVTVYTDENVHLIPEYYHGYKVAFAELNLNSVTSLDKLTESFPSFILNIDDSYFDSKLKVDLTEYYGVLYYKNIAYKVADNTKETYHIKPGTKYIAEKCFQSCKNAKEIIIPDSVESIGSSAFSMCYKLEKIILPAKLSYVGGWLFEYSSNVTVYCKFDHNKWGDLWLEDVKTVYYLGEWDYDPSGNPQPIDNK